MDMQSIRNSVLLESISISDSSGDILYVFSVNGREYRFVGKACDSRAIRAIAYTEELDDFMMPLTQLDNSASKTLVSLTLAWLDGKHIDSPVAITK